MRLRDIVIVIVGLCCLVVIFAGPSFRRKLRSRTDMRREREWIWLKARELVEAGPPSAELQYGANTGRWVQQGYLLFSNGWAGYQIHTSHACDRMGNMALLRTDDGILYLSKLHYCGGIADWMASPRDDLPRPANAVEFLSVRGRYQEWNRLSPDGRVACIIRSPDEKRNRVTIWIGRADGPHLTTFLDEQYQVPRFAVAWSTYWLSNERVNVEFYNYNGRDVLSVFEPDENPPSNHIATLAFHLDHKSGRFTDKE